MSVTLYETLLIEIKRCNDIDEPIWLAKLIYKLFESRYQIRRHLDNLIEFGMIEGKFGFTNYDTVENNYCTKVSGYMGYRYYITDIGREQLHKMTIQ